MAARVLTFDQAKTLEARYWESRRRFGLLAGEYPSRDYEGYLTQAALGREYGVSNFTVNRIVRGQSYQTPAPASARRQNPRRLTRAAQREVAERYAAGEGSYRGLAVQYGVSYTRVWQIVKQHQAAKGENDERVIARVQSVRGVAGRVRRGTVPAVLEKAADQGMVRANDARRANVSARSQRGSPTSGGAGQSGCLQGTPKTRRNSAGTAADGSDGMIDGPRGLSAVQSPALGIVAMQRRPCQHPMRRGPGCRFFARAGAAVCTAHGRSGQAR